MNSDDIIVWPDGDWCYRDELEGMTYKSDDYRVISVDTDEWNEWQDHE